MYAVFNDIEGVWCERVFAPWVDMEEQIRSNGVHLYGLESGDSIRDFDVIAFSLGYELSYTNVLNMLDLAGIPLRSADREEYAPLVIAGGSCCFNPEPLSDFIDLFVVGEGEEAGVELMELLMNSGFGIRNSESKGRGRKNRESKYDAGNKKAFLRHAASLPGIYVPLFYDVRYNEDGTIGKVAPRNGAPMPVMKRIVKNLDEAKYPTDTIIPSTSIVHDRAVLELFRGCIRGCRFCQAGFTGRPVRSRSVETLSRQGIEALQNSGYDELGLLSLSTSDYKELNKLCDGLINWCEPRNISLSLPSLRAGSFSVELMDRVQKIRKSGLTFAPEAGSQRLRHVINKDVTEDEFLETCRLVFEGGWSSVKLYFMLGLPTETDEDVLAIADISYKVLNTWKKHAMNKSRGVRITVSTSCFVPKPLTPFQWEAQISMTEFLRRVDIIKKALRTKSITYSWHSPEQAFIEASIARGDRRIGGVIEAAWRRGAKLDSWSEYFSLDNWLAAFEECGLDPDFYSLRERGFDEVLPWNVVTAGVSLEHLKKERNNAGINHKTPDCRTSCSECGASALVSGGQCNV